jgi:hypothetical protein
MSDRRRYALVLSIYLNTRGFAFVLFEEHLSPFDWGVQEIRGPQKSEQCLARITKTFDQFRPDVLVIQDTSPQGTRRAPRIAELNARIAEVAQNRSIPVFSYSRDDLHSAFGDSSQNKQALAELIAKHVPVFERYVPPPRKPWMSEDSRMGLFDAVALGLVFYKKTGGPA